MPDITVRVSVMPPRPVAPDGVHGPTDRPARPSLTPDWWEFEQRVLIMLAAHTAEMGPWDAAMAVFADHPRPARGRQRPDAGRSPLGILTDAWCNRRRHTEEPR